MSAVPQNKILPLVGANVISADDSEIPDTPSWPKSSITKVITCHYSGIVLARLDICIYEGHLPYFEAHNETVYTHPFYGLSSMLLIKKLEDSLKSAQEHGWILSWREQQRLQLLTSALMHHLGILKQDRATLPSYPIAAASAHRLLTLAKWFFFLTSQRLEFPIYSVSAINENLQWENYKFWLDSAFTVRHEWNTKVRKGEVEYKKKAHEVALKELKDSEVYKRLDLNKIWNWIEIQLVDAVGKGRTQTFKSLFLNGDVEIHEWTKDDIDDLIVAVEEHCDNGNTIMFFIKKRLRGMLALYRDFYESFTLLGGKKAAEDEGPTQKEQAFFDGFDQRAAQLEEMPPAPKRESFETLGKFLKAQAEWNILNKRWNALQKQKAYEQKEFEQAQQRQGENNV